MPASLLLGVLWGLWHLPLLIANGLIPLTSLGLVNFLLYDVTITTLAVLFTWFYNNTNGNLLLLVLFHAVAGATTSLFLFLVGEIPQKRQFMAEAANLCRESQKKEAKSRARGVKGMDRILRDSAGSQQDCMLDSLLSVYQNIQIGLIAYH